MRVFVFGAGASKASQEQVPVGAHQLPPLVNELFAQADYTRLAGEVGLPRQDFDELRNLATGPGFSLEEWLTREWLAVETLREEQTKRSRRTDFGRLACYIWRLLLYISSVYAAGSTYGFLLTKLRKRDEPFGLINFNYDTLLDRALQDRYGAELFTLEDYLSWNYVKPHGSVNWFLLRRASEGDLPEEGVKDVSLRFRACASRMFNGPPIPLDNIRVVDPSHRDLGGSETILARFSHQHFYPLIFMPLTVKAHAFVEGFSQRIISRGTSMIAAADEVFLIGYRANDATMLEMLAFAKPSTLLHVIGRGQAEEVASRVGGAVQQLRIGTVSNAGFAEFVSTMP